MDIGHIARCRWIRGCRTSRNVNAIGALSIPTFSNVYRSARRIVIREHGLAIIKCRTLCPTAGSVADLRKSDLTRVLSDCTYINRDRIPHAAAASASTCTPNPKVKPISAPQPSVQTSVTLGSCQQPKASPNELSNLLCLSRT